MLGLYGLAFLRNKISVSRILLMPDWEGIDNTNSVILTSAGGDYGSYLNIKTFRFYIPKPTIGPSGIEVFLEFGVDYGTVFQTGDAVFDLRLSMNSVVSNTLTILNPAAGIVTGQSVELTLIDPSPTANAFVQAELQLRWTGDDEAFTEFTIDWTPAGITRPSYIQGT